MEMREYFKIIGNYWKVFVAIVILGTLATFIFTKMQPTKYTASTTFTVNKNSALKQTEVNYYLYDNYYNIESAGSFAQVVANWFMSPAFVDEVYKNAGLEVPNVSQSKLANTFRSAYMQPATIDVSISGSNKDELTKLINSAAVVVQEQTNKLGKNSDSFYEIAKFDPIVSQNNPSLILYTLIGFFASVLLGAVIVFAINYFSKKE